MRVKKSLSLSLFLLLVSLSLFGCRGKISLKDFTLTPVPILNISTQWGVNTAQYLTVHREPSSSSEVLSVLREGDTVKIREIREINLQWTSIYWYLIEKDNGKIGWANGFEIEIFNSRLKSESVGRSYKNRNKE